MDEVEKLTVKHARWPKRLIAGALCLIVLLVVVTVVLLVTRNHPQVSNDIPRSVTQQVQGFKVYFPKPGSLTSFSLVPQSVSYKYGVLIFSMSGPTGKSLIFTEEAIPAGYDISALQADKQYNNLYGQAFITDGTNRTTGALFTQDKTWILINAPQPIGANQMQQILDSLAPQ